MKSKIHNTNASMLAKEYQKSNFKILSKKLATFFLTIIIAGIAMSQTIPLEKDKSAIPKDTIKKSNVLVETQKIVSDSLVVPKGKYKLFKKTAHASYYADKFHGRRMANGKIFDMYKMTAAHKKLPFGTKIKITNEANGKSVVVEITDRGPFVKSREIDLSKGAFMAITKQKKSGMMFVTMEILQK